MKSFFSQNKKKIIAISLSVFLLAVFFFSPSIARAASDGEGVAKVLGWIIFPFVWVMGKLAVILLGILVKVAQYNDFIGSAAVTYGWVVVRDLCNMFFVLILLIIAFASILRVDSYNLKTWLPKLVIMAVLINFSKLICGIFIDFAQVIMLTFVNAFKDIAGANLTDMLGLTKILDFSQTGSSEVTAWTIIGSMILALVLSVIAVVVILTMLVMLAMRIVYLWVYIVLSPIAYLTAAFPQGRTKSERWWSEFSQYVIVGPVLAFFIWLAFVSLGGVAGSDEMKNFGVENTGNEFNQATTTNVALTEAGSEENLIKFIISVGMLLGGLMLAQEMGGKVGAIAGKGMAKLQTMGAGSIKQIKRNTGIERVQNAVKSYQQKKESTRSALALKDSDTLLKAEYYGKRAAAYVPNKIGQGASYVVKRPFELNEGKLNEREAAIVKKEDELKELKVSAESLDLRGEVESVKSLEANRQDSLKENEKELEGAKNLEIAQANFKSLKSEVFGLKTLDPENPNLAIKQKELDDEALKLGELKAAIGLDKNASESETNAKVSEIKDQSEQNKENINRDFDEKIAKKQNEVVEKYRSFTGETKEFNELSGNEGLDNANKAISSSISEKEKEITKEREHLNESRKNAEYVDKGVGAVIGTALGATVGAAFGAPLPFIGLKIAGTGLMGSAIGGGLGWNAKGNLKNAGGKALNLASNYNINEINKAKDAMKDKSIDEIRKISNDPSKTLHERAAASTIMMEKGELSPSEALVKKNEIAKNFKHDDKVMNQLDASLIPNYQSISKLFTTLEDTFAPAENETDEAKAKRIKKHEESKEKVVRGIVSGNIKIDNINDQNILNMIIPKLANTISATNLSNIYKGQTSKKQEMIEKSLKTAADKNKDVKSAKALVNITNNLSSLDDDEQKTKYMEGANQGQLLDLFDTAKGIDGVVSWIKNNSNLLGEIKKTGGDTKKVMSVLNQITKKSQLSIDNSKNKAAVNKLIEALKAKGEI